MAEAAAATGLVTGEACFAHVVRTVATVVVGRWGGYPFGLRPIVAD